MLCSETLGAWLVKASGGDREHPAGIRARGRTTGPAADGVMPVVLTPLSHPSYVTHDQSRLLVELCPELGVVDT